MSLRPLLSLVILLALFPARGSAQWWECAVSATSPQDGETWEVGRSHQLEWGAAGYDCYWIFEWEPYFNQIDLVGFDPGGGMTVVETFLMVPYDGVSPGAMEYTPLEAVVGYDHYRFRFWKEVPDWGLDVLGESPPFFIESAVDPLLVQPGSLGFVLPSGDHSASRKLYLTALVESVSWNASTDRSWLTVQPARGTSTLSGGASPLTVTVHGAGLPPGTHSASVLISAFSTLRKEITVPVRVSITADDEPADLRLSPARLVLTERIGRTIPPQAIQLTNQGTGATAWEAEITADWIALDPSEGYLHPGESAALTLTVSSRFTLAGSHRTYVHFLNSGSQEILLLVDVNLNTGAASGPWSSSPPARATLPVAANASGAYGSFWSTDVAFLPVGPAAQAAHARLKLSALAPGSPGRLSPAGDLPAAYREELASTATASVPRGTNQFIWGALGQKVRAEAAITTMDLPVGTPTLMLDILGQYFGQTGSSGFLQVKGEGGGDLVLASRTYSTDPGWETYGQSVQVPTAQEIIGPEGGTAFVPGLRYEPAAGAAKGWRSNLFITEIGGAATGVTVGLFNASGAPVGNTLSRTLEPFSQWQIINTADAFGTSEPWSYARVSSAGGGSVTALGSVVDNASNDPTTISGFVATPSARAPEDLILPAIVRTPGAYGTNWRSDVTLLNASASAVSIRAQFIPMAGAGSGVKEAVIPLGSGAMGVHTDIVSTLFGLESGTGTLKLLQADPGLFFAFNRIYNLAEDGSTFGQGTSAYRPGDAVGRYGGTLYALGLERSPKYRTNAGVVETGGSAAKVLFTIVSPSGESRGYLVDLLPGQWVQADDIIRDKAGFSEDLANVWVMIDVVEGQGKVVGYVSIVDNDSSDATLIKLAKH